MTFAVWLRYRLAYHHELYREVLGIFDGHVSDFYRQQAHNSGIKTAHTGSVQFLQQGGLHEMAEQEPLLFACVTASVQHRIALGDRAGRDVTRPGADHLRKWAEANVEIRGKLHAHHDGFDLHAKQLPELRRPRGSSMTQVCVACYCQRGVSFNSTKILAPTCISSNFVLRIH